MSSRSAALGLIVMLLASAAHGCRGYSDGVSPPSAPTHTPPASFEPAPVMREPPPTPPMLASDAGTGEPPNSALNPHDAAIDMDANTISVEDASTPLPNLRVAHSSYFDGYLTDGFGQPLYMFVGDATSAESRCLYDCAGAWPAFDVEFAYPAAELDPAQVSRFHRQDGAWQTQYKGRPLYYRTTEVGSREVSSDGQDLRWFVARDYLVFFSSARTFAPEGATAADSAFLTDGFGRTLYVCLDDQPSTAASQAISSCDAACLVDRPVFSASEAGRTMLLPSVIDPSELAESTRPDGLSQLTYRGWPLHYFSGDLSAGSTAGHNDRAWRAIDPVSFGRAVQPNSGN